MIMKAIVVEGKYDYAVLEGLFPQLSKRVMLRHAQGFSSAFAMMKTLIDYGYEVLAVFDTDSNKPDNDNRKIIERILPNNIVGRHFTIVWMDSCIEDVLERAVPGFNKGRITDRSLMTKATRYRQEIFKLSEFQEIQKFIDG